MIISVRSRVNKVDLAKTASPLNHNSFIVFDNCTEVKYNQRVTVDKETFKAKVRGSIRGWKELPNSYSLEPIKHLHFLLKDPELETDENNFHYNIIEWKDRLSGEWHQLRFDTFAFLQNDNGDTIKKIEG